MTAALAVSRRQTSAAGLGSPKRWPALIVLCLGVLMIMLDVTVVNVALSSIRDGLNFTENSLVWVVNAYMLTFGGSMLLGGRLGDLYGHRKLFLIGITLFTIASLACGLATTRGLLVASRAVQGLGGAVVTTVALSLIMNIFTDRAERATAMAVYSFVCAGGGSIGLLFGGTLVTVLNWHWIFLVNFPIGVAVYALCLSLVPNVAAKPVDGRLDVWGALTVMTSLMLVIYAIVNGNESGWASAQTLGMLACSAASVAGFIVIEAVMRTPLLPLGIFRIRNLTISNIVGILWWAGGSTWFFISALYMQLVLGYTPMQVGLAFLPANLITGAFALGLSATLVRRFGIKGPISIGLLLVTISIALFARVPLDGSLMTDILPSMILLGAGAGIAYNPLVLAAMSEVDLSDYGLASGVVNTACMMGSALGLAILASLCAARTDDLLASGSTTLVALTGGYRIALVLAAVCVGTAALLGVVFLRTNVYALVPGYASAGAIQNPGSEAESP